MYYLISLLLTAATLWPSELPRTPQVRVDNIRESKGCVRLAIFADSATFLDYEDALHLDRIPLSQTGNSVVFELPQLDAGRYAIAVYHDQNNNDKLDSNLLGIPSEPYAFSREPDSKWREPSWSEVAIDYRPEQTILRLTLKTWGER